MPHKVWAVGEEVIAADFQAYLQNQTVAQFPNVAARDTWAGPPDGALAVTTDNNVIWQRMAGAWVALLGTGPRARAERTTLLALADQTATAVPFTEARYQSGAMWAAGTPSRLTITTPGLYSVGAFARFSNAPGYRQAQLRRAGTDLLAIQGTNGVSGGVTDLTLSTEVELVLGDYLELVVFHNAGTTVNVNSTPKANLWASWRAPLSTGAGTLLPDADPPAQPKRKARKR